MQGFVLQFCPELRSTNAVLVVDYYDVLHFETLELVASAPMRDQAGLVRAAVEVLGEQARSGDFFLCSTTRQRDLWLGHLAAHGRLNPATYRADPRLDRLVVLVPFGVPDDPPAHTRQVLRGIHPAVGLDAELLIWAGGIYDWLDPLTLIRAVAFLAPSRPKLRLYFFGTRHPNPAATEPPMVAAARRLAGDLGLLDSVVVFNDGWVDYDARQNYLLEADVGVTAHAVHLETEFSFRTRVLDYLWAGLPVVTTVGDEFARLVTDHECGVAVPPGQEIPLAQAIEWILDDPERKATYGARSQGLGRCYSWSRVLAPLVGFCAQPRYAADRVPQRHGPV